THLLDPADAHVVDDIIVWWLRDDEFMVMPNASNTGPLLGALQDTARAAGGSCAVDDVTAHRVVLAVQGPKALDLLAKVAPDAESTPRLAVRPLEWDGAPGWVAGTGYTGEPGVELHVPAAAAVSAWRSLLDAGLTPAGLAARDTLRLEMGFP